MSESRRSGGAAHRSTGRGRWPDDETARLDTTMAGISGGFGGAFTSPGLGTLFVSELAPTPKDGYIESILPQLIAATVALMLRLLHRRPDGSVACTHGDMLQELVGFIDNVEDLGDPIPFDKGGIWVLSRSGDDVLSVVEHLSATQATVDDRMMISCPTE